MANIRIQTHRLKKGMLIAVDVYNCYGAVIVPEGTIVTKEVFELLTKNFIDDVVVEYNPPKREMPVLWEDKTDSGEKKRKMQEFSQSFQIAEETVSQNLKELVFSDKEIDVPALVETIQNVVNHAEDEAELCEMLFRIRRTSENLYTHSVNVALYAELLARWVGFTEKEIQLALIASLLHDIGHLKYAEDSFSMHADMDKSCHERHSVDGYKMVQDKKLEYPIKQAILTHHERLDESGFPMGVSYKNINGITRVLSIADSYATLTVNEPGHAAMLPLEILQYMQVQEFGKYDAVYLRTFMEHLAQTFIQKEVLLNDGKKGTIVMLNKLDLTRPLVQIEENYFIDLAVKRDLCIKEILE